MIVLENISLKPYNTFGVESYAKLFGRLQNANDLPQLLAQGSAKYPILILGEGSNVLFVNDFDGLVLLNELKGIELLHEDEDECLIRVSAGENWSDFVDYSVARGWGGIENLSLIPGTAGAAPIQNIGAYGIELCEVLVEVEACDLNTGEIKVFANSQCEFGYRTSIFKTIRKGQYLITAMTLRLSKKPVLNLSYAPLKKAFEGRESKDIHVKEVSDVVKAIRRSKLPDPLEIGNAGSFFKNPLVGLSQVKLLQLEFPNIPVYPVGSEHMKVAAGWLIEKCGWKGRRIGDAGVHEKQALVLVNYGRASGKEIFEVSENIQKDVEKQFGILLEREVTVV